MLFLTSAVTNTQLRQTGLGITIENIYHQHTAPIATPHVVMHAVADLAAQIKEYYIKL